MALPQPKDDFYTYADYLEWDDSERWELIDGVAYAMSAPLTRHQRLLRRFVLLLGNFLEGKPCELFPAPFDVRLDADDYDDTVVQPDLLVVCDKTKLDEKGCKGAPDLIIEIISPSSARMDRFLKFNKYQQSGVREYWIVDPETNSVQVCVLEGGRYFVTAYGDEDDVAVTVLPGCQISLKDVLAE
jgi:Uma2 family endonuclease